MRRRSRFGLAAVLATALGALGCYADYDFSDGSHPCDACRECEACFVDDDGYGVCLPVQDARQQCAPDGDVHWFDACGEREGDQVDDCLACEVCLNTSAETAECRAAEEQAYQQCGADGDVHWYDSCDVEGEVAEDCADGCTDSSDTTAGCE